MQQTTMLENFDRLLLLIAQPAPGWELQFEEILAREVARLWPVSEGDVGDE
ncbi:MAG TPA: hypothetical protein VNA27_05990 [Rubrobacteraceae bacterium]|nr:hypothetical protein [Rubrobacteraceae bacterium]